MPLLDGLPTHRRNRRAAHAMRAMSLVALSMLLQARVATAQTLFLPPDTVVDVAKYSTLEECVAAILRVQDEVRRQDRHGPWNDTLPWNPKEPSKALPPQLISTAQRCLVRFPAANVPLSEFSLILPYYLIANRDAEVATMATRRLAAVTSHGGAPRTGGVGPASIDPERMAVLDTVFSEYVNAKPARFSAAESLAVAFDKSIPRPMTAKPAERLMGMYLMLAGKSVTLSDTVGMRKFGARTTALLDSLAPAERIALRENMDENGYNLFAYTARVATAGYGIMLDSLRRSTAAYLALQKDLWVKSTGERPEASGFPIGRQAPLVHGATSGPAGSNGPRPVPGKVNLVIFVDQACTDVLTMFERLNYPSICRGEAASLRRVSALFPALEITIVDRTRGAFMYTPPSTPDEEAALIKKAIDAHQVPGTTVVGTTEYIRLPAPDRRRIEKKELPNTTPYSFGKSWPAEQGAVFLIDQSGIIILPSGQMTREGEPFLNSLIGVLLTRPASLGATNPGQ
jgi:hypothetical protein